MNVVITTRGKTHENIEGPWYDRVSFEGESSPTGIFKQRCCLSNAHQPNMSPFPSQYALALLNLSC